MSRLKKLNYNIILPATLLFGLLMLLGHKDIPILGDDLQYSKVTMVFIEWIRERYHSWSSRVVIESVMFFVAKSFFVWKILDTFMLSLLYYFFMKIFAEKVDRKNCLIGALCILIYPFIHMGGAGYLATTLNYLWPLTFAFAVGYSMKKSICRLKIHIWEYPFYIFSLLFAGSQEQLCAFLFGLLLLLFVFDIYQKHQTRINYTILAYWVIIFLVLLSHLLCPGISNRFGMEIKQWWPDYKMLGLAEKIQLAYSSTLSHFMFNRNYVFTTFCLMLYVAVRVQYKDVLYRIIAFIPLASSLFFGIGESRLSLVLDISKWNYFNKAPGVIKMQNSDDFYIYIPLFVLGIISLCVLVSIYLCFRNEKHKMLLSISLILLGFATRAIMGFSPTIWVSGARTFLFLYFVLIICTFLCYQKIRAVEYKGEGIIMGIMAIMAILANLDFLRNMVNF